MGAGAVSSGGRGSGQADLPSLMLDVMRRARLKRRALLRSLGVTRAQLGALHVLMHGDELDMKELANRLEVSQPSATATVDALVRDGLAERHADSQDGRVVLVHLTDKSRGLIGRLREMQIEQVEGLMAGLTGEERVALAALLDKIAKTGGGVPEE